MSERMTGSDATLAEALGRSNTWGKAVRDAILDDWKRARETEATLSTLHHEARQEVVRLQQRIMELVDQDARYQAYIDAAQHVVREWWKEAMGNLPGPALDLLLGRLQNIDLTMLAPQDKERKP